MARLWIAARRYSSVYGLTWKDDGPGFAFEAAGEEDDTAEDEAAASPVARLAASVAASIARAVY